MIKHYVLWVIVALLVAHIFILMFHLKNYQKEQRMEDESIYSFVKMTQLISKNLSPQQIEEILHYVSKENIGLDDYLIQTSISATPLHELKISGSAELDKLKDAVGVQHLSQLSYKLNHAWLNLSMKPAFSIYHIALVYLMVELIVIGIILLFSWSIWRFTAPLRGVRQIVQKIGHDLNINLPDNSKNDPMVIREVSEEIKQMQQRIHSLLDTRTKLVAAIAHDLRTPITRLRLIAQFVPEPQSEKIIHNLEEMGQMINTIFTFATIDSAHDKKVKTDIIALLDSLYEDSLDMGHELTLKYPEQQVLIQCRFVAIKRAFSNILENAIKYGQKVHITLEIISPDKVMIVFEDEGPGVPEDTLQKVFEAYYRLEQPMRKNIPGMGLGLTIAYEIIDAHGGTISLENIQPTGLRVKVILPVGDVQ